MIGSTFVSRSVLLMFKLHKIGFKEGPYECCSSFCYCWFLFSFIAIVFLDILCCCFFFKWEPNQATGVSAHTNAKKWKREWHVRRAKKNVIEAQRAKSPASTHAIYALIGEEEQKGKRREKKNKQGVDPQPRYLVATYDMHRSYGGPSLKPLRPQELQKTISL